MQNFFFCRWSPGVQGCKRSWRIVVVNLGAFKLQLVATIVPDKKKILIYFSCYVNLSFLYTSDVFHINNSIRYFRASASFLLHTSCWQELFRESLSRLTLDLLSWSHSLMSLCCNNCPQYQGLTFSEWLYIQSSLLKAATKSFFQWCPREYGARQLHHEMKASGHSWRFFLFMVVGEDQLCTP